VGNDGKYSQVREGAGSPGPRIAGYPAALSSVALPGGAVALYTVADLETLVDREALLRGDAEPPYWAHLWTGARCLAAYLARWIDARGRRVLDAGCGLGLPGLAAARGGGTVLFVDTAAPALAFVEASARVNGLTGETLCADFGALAPDLRFDLILAAEVAYDPKSFASLADLFVRHLAPGGVGLLADGFRTDTRPLYRALAARRLATHATEVRAIEEGRLATVRLTVVGVAPSHP
jgi:predicted nicotinamide N-methyase